jgi:hypothetical protein
MTRINKFSIKYNETQWRNAYIAKRFKCVQRNLRLANAYIALKQIKIHRLIVKPVQAVRFMGTIVRFIFENTCTGT